ncbi:MAG: hypothetical protein H6810_06070 [Phycisphaeraceae bacterium]|nr:MAG: hypothetical protein H6810_06070 [Phycisphaeraceae bacterium]
MQANTPPAAFIAGAIGLATIAAAQPTTLVNYGPAGVQGNGFNPHVAASVDGRHVVFASTSTNLVPGGTSGRQVFAADRDPDGNGVLDEGNTVVTLMSLGYDGLPGNGTQGGFNGQFGVDISANGRFVLWSSQSTNLVQGDTTGFGTYDVFVRDRDPDGNGVYDEGNGVNERINMGIGGSEPNHGDNGADQMGISDDGRYVVFSSSSSNLVVGDTQDTTANIYLHDRQTGLTSRLDFLTSDQNYSNRYPQISADGNWIVYAGYGPPFGGAFHDIIVVDRNGNFPVLISKDDNGVPGNGASGTNPNTRGPRISGDGRFVVFQSLANNLDVTRTGDPSNAYKLFLHDRDADGDGIFDEPGAFTTRRIDVGPGGVSNDGFNAADPDISDDGSRVVFKSASTNLVPGDTTLSLTVTDIYLLDRNAGTLEIVSRATNGDQGPASSSTPVLAGDGDSVLFNSLSTNLIPNDNNGRDDVFARVLPPAACNAADLTAPFGLLDLADVNAFVSGFLTADPIADLNGDRLFDLQDVLAFTAAFLGGC